MAIQNRRGNYSDFDPEKMVPGEWATVLSGDPNAGDGKSIYHCFSAGNVKRMATYEDMEDNINKATDDIRNEFLEDINNATQSANTAATSANQAAQTAQKAAQDAQNAAESIEGAVEGTIINDQTPSNVTAFSGKYVDDTFLKKTGDATNTTVKFAPPDEEQDLVSGEKSGTLFGKIVKKLSVIKAAIGTLSSLTTTNKSSLVDAVNELNSALISKARVINTSWGTSIKIPNVSATTYPHGLLINGQTTIYLIWVAGIIGELELNKHAIYGNDDPNIKFSVDPITGEVTVTSADKNLRAFLYIGF